MQGSDGSQFLLVVGLRCAEILPALLSAVASRREHGRRSQQQLATGAPVRTATPTFTLSGRACTSASNNRAALGRSPSFSFSSPASRGRGTSWRGFSAANWYLGGVASSSYSDSHGWTSCLHSCEIQLECLYRSHPQPLPPSPGCLLPLPLKSIPKVAVRFGSFMIPNELIRPLLATTRANHLGERGNVLLDHYSCITSPCQY